MLVEESSRVFKNSLKTFKNIFGCFANYLSNIPNWEKSGGTHGRSKKITIDD